MNAPLPRHLAQALQHTTLDDKYRLDRGHAFMSGIHALVKLPMLQQQRDAQQGKRTAGFISGYRGSPLGGYDQALWAAESHLKERNIVFQPGVNEELGATAVWGTQQLGYAPAGSNKFDGVFGIWYGKGPGVDRCSDVFKHANMAGTTPWGGAIAVAGDDHIGKSSTVVHQSDHIFKACGLPVFFPTNVQEILDLGLHAFAMSRFAGLWSGLKTIQEIVESSATVAIDPDRVRIVLPTDFELPPGGLHIRWPDTPHEQEARMMHFKWYAALAYVRANRLNHNVIEGPNDRYGIMASGKAFNDTRQALLDLGLDDATCRRIGIRLHKVNVVWPLEAQLTREFATGLQEILVVEEKRQIIEYQLKEELYNWRADVRPSVVGKYASEAEHDGQGHAGGEWSRPNPTANTLLRAHLDLNPALIARALVKRLKHTGIFDTLPTDLQAHIHAQLAMLEASEASVAQIKHDAAAPDMADAVRVPWFCSGCPHNTSTRVPEGSRALGGIGCHYMATWMPDRATIGFTQMGGEGVPWVGQHHFSNERHVFANLGDGTYFHSGLLAIRQSIAAGANITYKILYNDAVAMTGGQRVGERPEGHSVLQIAESLHAEGVKKLLVVTDAPEKYAGVQIPGNYDGKPVQVLHRSQLEDIQRELREVDGVTAIIYDQTCATEKRRRRKRGQMAESTRRVVINELVCEGCGDCGVQSNCLSVEPLETDFGRKRTINQASCNKDFSCVQGFCPSFVTVEGGQLRQASRAAAVPLPLDLGELPEPSLPEFHAGADPWGVVVAGVGGTGVITIGQLLGMAAHMEGKGIVTQDAAGLAQKGGATWSHVLIAPTQDAIQTTRVRTAAADLILACDPIVAVHEETLVRLRRGRTHVALNAHSAPAAGFVHNPEWQNPQAACERELIKAVGESGVASLDFDGMATALLGDTIYVNPMVLGYAWQRGWLPLRRETLWQAMVLNRTAVPENQRAFDWGRQAALRPEAVMAAAGLRTRETAQVIHFKPRDTLSTLLATRMAFLTAYQNAAYAQRYQGVVDRVVQAEAGLGPDPHGKLRTTLAQAVARSLFKLMAYKDEYEVARLHADPAFHRKLSEQFEGPWQLTFHLAPPLLAKTNAKGELQKSEFGPSTLILFRLLARLKGLRGTWLDVFGKTEERQAERAAIEEYVGLIDEVLKGLSNDNHPLAVEIASVPERIRGYGHVKARNVAAAKARWGQLLAAWRRQAPDAARMTGASSLCRERSN